MFSMLPKVVPLTNPDLLDLKGPVLPESVANERLIPSGVFYTEDPRPECVPVMCNPWFFGSLKEGESFQISLEEPRDLRARYGEIVTVFESQLDSYAEMIVRVRAEFSVNPVDVVVVPLCGALRPASLIYPMGNFDLTMLPIPFTRGSSGQFDAQILTVLGEQLSPFYSRDSLTVGVLDTGIGGQSITHLVRLLRKLHDDAVPHNTWDVRCNVVIAADNHAYLDSTNVVKQARSERFTITRSVFMTENLVAEDAKAAIPYEVDWGNAGAGYINSTSHAGALVLRRPEGLEVHPTDDIARSLDHEMAKATTRALQNPRNIFVGDIWEPGNQDLL